MSTETLGAAREIDELRQRAERAEAKVKELRAAFDDARCEVYKREAERDALREACDLAIAELHDDAAGSAIEYDDGGPAFPVWVPDGCTDPYAPGMSLRDWFAGQVAAALLPCDDADDEDIAIAAYDFADVMLAEKRRRDGDA